MTRYVWRPKIGGERGNTVAQAPNKIKMCAELTIRWAGYRVKIKSSSITAVMIAVGERVCKYNDLY